MSQSADEYGAQPLRRMHSGLAHNSRTRAKLQINELAAHEYWFIAWDVGILLACWEIECKKLGVNGALREGIDLSASRLLVSAAWSWTNLLELSLSTSFLWKEVKMSNDWSNGLCSCFEDCTTCKFLLLCNGYGVHTLFRQVCVQAFYSWPSTLKTLVCNISIPSKSVLCAQGNKSASCTELRVRPGARFVTFCLFSACRYHHLFLPLLHFR